MLKPLLLVVSLSIYHSSLANANVANYVFMHIPKTGGFSANHIFGSLLGVDVCKGNRFFRDVAGVRRVLDSSRRAGVFARDCRLLTYEARLAQLRQWLTPSHVAAYRVLSFVRNPLSHWFSAWQHMYRLKVHGRADGLDSLPQLVHQLERGVVSHYDLRNFQLSFFGDTLGSALLELRRVFWFGLTEESTLSYALLQCQVFGYVNATLLSSATEIVYNPSMDFNYTISAGLLKRLNQLNEQELRFYSLTVAEFWRRVNTQIDCLSATQLIEKDLFSI
jgi:hypothetical protein